MLLIFTLLFPATDLQNKHMYAGHSFPVYIFHSLNHAMKYMTFTC